ncbi:MAG TPA: serine/threonine-protein kinase [Candidatus Obscuribacterales bacterium]
MPLQDSFGKKASKRPETADQPKVNRAKNLSGAPNIDELMEALRSAQETIRQPVMLTWRKPIQGGFLLTVIRNSDEDYQPTWILHEDKKESMDVLWTYTTSDTELIYNLINEQVAEYEPGRPKAVIPESLRPQQPAPKAPEPAAGSQQPHPGQPQFFENYEIINTIGQGGMGIIYKARDRNDGQFVALKVLRADLMVDKSNISRFKHEAAAVRGLKHANLIALKEFGLSRFGQPFLAMDYLEGVELKTVLERCNHLDIPTFVNVFTQICDALAYTHEQGLVHRDLKPGNIMLVKNASGQDTVKIIDFGIAKSLREQTTVSITSYGQFLGSPAYMSPEQCGGAVLDSRSDIYSLGCVMYEAIAGVLPFKHENILKTVMAQVQEMAPPFSAARPDLSIHPRLEEIIFKSLQKDPDDRYQTARDLSEDLWGFVASGLSPAQSAPAPPALRPLAQTQPLNRQSVGQIQASTVSEPIAAPGFPSALSAQPPAPKPQAAPGPHVPPQQHSSPPQPVPPPAFFRQGAPQPPMPAQPNVSSGQLPAYRDVPSGQWPAYKDVPSGQMPAYREQPSPVAPAPQQMPQAPAQQARQPEQPAPSEMAMALLRGGGVINDKMLIILQDCVQSLQSGEITFEQAVTIIKHASGKHGD